MQANQQVQHQTRKTKAVMADKNWDRHRAATCWRWYSGKRGYWNRGRTVVSSPFSVGQVKHYFGNVKGVPAITELVDIIKNGVPVKTSVANLDPTREMQHGNHSTVVEHMDLVWEKLFEDIRRNRVLLICLLYTSPSPRD